MKHSRRLPRLSPIQSLASWLGLALVAASAAHASVTPADSSAAAKLAQDEADAIQAARLAEIFDRDVLGLDVLQTCKYVSGISTPPPRNVVALTFDDGPDAATNAAVRGVLHKYDLSATFFLLGQRSQASPGVVRQIQDHGGLLIGNHSWNHADFHKLSTAAQKTQIVNTRNLLGAYQPQKFFRYPYGNSSCASNALAHSLGYKIVGWHVDSCDWGFNATGTVSVKNGNICGVKAANRSNFVRHVTQSLQASRGGILLMHEIQHHTIRQLEEIVEALIREGFTFGALDDAGFAPSMR